MRHVNLVLLPGLDGTGVLFRPFLQVLPASITPHVIAYPAQTPMRYDQLIDYVQTRLPNDGPMVLLGESFGGPLSLWIAAKQPTNLVALILCGSFVSCPYTWVPPWADEWVMSWPFGAFPFFSRCKASLNLYETREHFDLAQQALCQVAPAVFAERVREIIRVNVVEELRSCATPLLYLQGTRDRVVPLRNLERIRAIKTEVRTARIDSGHMILKTRPHAALRAIVDFLTSLPTLADGSTTP